MPTANHAPFAAHSNAGLRAIALLALCLLVLGATRASADPPAAEAPAQDADRPAESAAGEDAAADEGSPWSWLAWAAGIVTFVFIFGCGIAAEIEGAGGQEPQHIGGGLYLAPRHDGDGPNGCAGCAGFVIGLALAIYVASTVNGWLGANH